MFGRKFVYEMIMAEAHTVDERPHKEGDDVGNGEDNLSEIEAERPNGAGRSERKHPISIHDSEGKTSGCQGGVPCHPTIGLDIGRFLLAGK